MCRRYIGQAQRYSAWDLDHAFAAKVRRCGRPLARWAKGLILAIVLVYLLMATNYQSWLDPFLIMMALPGALAGVLWMLVVTHTTLNVESLMGAIMAVGVATTNGNLLITFANEHMEKEGSVPLSCGD